MTGAARAGSGASPLYTREILAAAMKLSGYPLLTDLPIVHEMRSKTCGSVVRVSIALENGHVGRYGISAQACALGQASAAQLAQHVGGKSLSEIAAAEAALSDYLHGRSEGAGEWPGINMLMPAKDYPARRDSVLLPWRTTIAALEQSEGI